MIDQAEILVKAGSGGNGCISFRREKYVPKGGPDGGNGGKGGDVTLVASNSVTTLVDQQYTKHYDAYRGAHGMGKTANGYDGLGSRVTVPIGTTVFDADTGEVIADMTAAGFEVVVAHGGLGGRGNVTFKSSGYQAPRVAEKGEPGEERRLRLEVRLIADVGLVGYPNAGKSTLLSHVSEAKPRVASYPFTTLEPNLGVVSLEREQNFVMADMPGLIEGAHEGVGLGHDFLRHVERTRMLLHIVDVAAVDGREPLDDLKAINRELMLHSDKLADLPQIIVLNKADLPDAQARLPELQAALGRHPSHVISAATGEGVEELMRATYTALTQILTAEAEAEPAEEPQRVDYVPRRGFSIERSPVGDGYVVEGDAVRRTVVMTDFENEEAVWLLQRRLNRMGLWRALKRAKVKDGDTVQIGDRDFEFSGERQATTLAQFLATKRQAARREGGDDDADERDESA
ncbi:GTPase ObgE [Candidatus Poribacteria bacterium]|nr:GTPase ObgE [Candidatus Poribacteria bacterium]